MPGEETNRLAQVIRAKAKSLRAEFEATEVVQHGGTKGSWRENVVRTFLEAYLPGNLRIAHGGEIVSVSGRRSNECDIIIFDRNTPPFLVSADGAVVPCECTYGVVEVKTRLTKKELIDACEKIRRAKSLEKTAFRELDRPLYEHNGKQYDYFPTVGMIFAFSGPNLASTADNLRSWMVGKAVDEWPDSVWVLGKGYIAWWNTSLNLLDITPSSTSSLAVCDAEPELDILLPFALNLNIVFGQAAMAPLMLSTYSRDTPLGRNIRIWSDE
jgi:hypothetical protein